MTEVRPTEAGRALGRLLGGFDAPAGMKTRQAILALAEWLADAPQTFDWPWPNPIDRRASVHEDRPKRLVQISENRPLGFRRELQTFLYDVAGGAVDSSEGNANYLHLASTALFNQPPEIRE